MSHSALIGGALAALLLAAPTTTAQTESINFKAIGSITTPAFVSGHLTITADDGTNPAQVNILNLNGMGVIGNANSMVDGIEAVHFSYDVPVIEVAYTVFVANNGDADGFVGEAFIEAFSGATSLGVVGTNDTGWKYINQMFGGVPITAFTVRADNEGCRIDTTTCTVDPWAVVGPGLAGTQGMGVLKGSGLLTPNSAMTVRATKLLQNHVGAVIFGFSLISAPFKGGVLGPNPDAIFAGLPTGAQGVIQLTGTYPPGVPSGTTFYTQVWWTDAAGVLGFAATNSLSGTNP